MALSGEIVGGGYATLEFPLSLLPHGNLSQTVNITLTLPDGSPSCPSVLERRGFRA